MQEVHDQILKVLTSFYGAPTADQCDHIASMAGAVMGEAVAPELERLRAELAKASDALCAVGKAALVVAPTLAKPYPDAPKTSPWQQFMERPVRDAYNLGKRIRRELKEARDAR